MRSCTAALKSCLQSLEPRMLFDGTITGVVYRSISGKNTYQPSDPSLAGWTVYVDLNHDGVRQTTEPAAVTDATGRYTITGLAAGSYSVREDVVTAYQPRPTPQRTVLVNTNQTTSNIDFGNKQLIDSINAGLSSNQDAVNNGLPLSSPNAPGSSLATSGKLIAMANNNSISFYRRKDYLQLKTQSLASFFAGQPNAASATDPKVLYDSSSSRFIVFAIANTSSGSQLLIATSSRKQNPATAKWRYHSIDAQATTSTGFFAANPSITFDHRAIYVSADLTDAAGAVSTSRLWILDKALAFSKKGTDIVSVYDPSAEASVPGQLTNMQLAGFSGKKIQGIAYTYLVASVPSSSGAQFDVIKIQRSLHNPIFSLQAIAAPSDVSVAPATNLPPAAQPPAPGGSRGIDTNIAPLDAAWRGSYLWIADTYVPSTGPDAGTSQVYWFEIKIKNKDFQLVDDGAVSGSSLGAGTSTFAPALAIDRDNYLVLSFAASGPNVFPGAYVTGRKTNDPAHTLRAAYAVSPGQADYSATVENSGLVNWGSNATVLDSRDPNRFWVLAHYSSSSDTVGAWGQTLLAFRLPPRFFPVVD